MKLVTNVSGYLHSLIIFFLLVQAAKVWMTEKETGIVLNSTFILQVYNYSVEGNVLSEPW